MVKASDRDKGLMLAIERAGSVSELARLLGIATPSLMEWRKVPTHRILQIEAATGIPREQLRPDLYRPPSKQKK